MYAGSGRNNRVSKVNMANLGNNRNHSSHMLCVGPILSGTNRLRYSILLSKSTTILSFLLLFVMTREHALLWSAIDQLHKVPLKEERGPQKRMHLKSLFCKYESEEGSQVLTFLQSFITPIQKWADKQLSDYHLNFPEALAMMENVVSISIIARRLLQEEHGSVCNK